VNIIGFIQNLNPDVQSWCFLGLQRIF